MTVYRCDFCKKIVEDYTSYILPVNEYVYVESRGVKFTKFKKGVTSQKIDLCAECSQALANLYDAYLND